MAQGYGKIDILGKGGKAIVWLAMKEGEKYAIKQFPKTNGTYDKSADAEIQFSECVNGPEISKLVSKIEDRNDLWLVYELGSKTLSQRLCIIKGENLPSGDRVYTIMHQSFYKCLS